MPVYRAIFSRSLGARKLCCSQKSARYSSLSIRCQRSLPASPAVTSVRARPFSVTAHTRSPAKPLAPFALAASSPSSSRFSSNMALPPDHCEKAVHLHWNDITAEKIDDIKQQVIAIGDKMVATVSAVPLSDVTYENTVQVFEDTEREISTLSSMVDFPSMVYADKAIRDASTEADKAVSDYLVALKFNKDLFDRVVAFKEKSYDSLDAQGKRFVDHSIRDGRRIGFHLDEEVQKKVKAIDQQLSKLSIDFSRNLAEESTTLTFTKEELDGMPNDFIGSLEKNDDGKYIVTLKYPHTVPIGTTAKNPDTRRQVNVAFNSRCKEANTKLLEEMLELRKEKASLLGYASFADYILEIRMAGNSADVKTFLTGLSDRITPLFERESAKLLEYKKEECSKLGLPFDGKINAWDVNYYKTRVEEKEYSIDQEAFKVYFPMEKVTKGLLDIYQTLLSVVFTKVEKADVWHPDVTMYQVTEKSNGWILGYFYLDLHPREGKYGHAAVFPLQSSTALTDGLRQVPVCAMVANFTKPTAEKPSLLLHREVETYFHEFGHVMHHICSMKSQYTRFSGTRVERDFVEAPSQMLENWCWEKEPLQLMSGHFETGEPLPEAMITKLGESRNANIGLFSKRQLCFGLFDQYIHTCQEKVDTRAVFDKFCSEINGYTPAEGTSFPATFNHIAGGYEAQYYGYMWSDVFSYDMFFSRFEKEGVLSPVVGKQYRDCILAPGGSKDAKDLLRDFLGREPNEDAFLEKKGLNAISS